MKKLVTLLFFFGALAMAQAQDSKNMDLLDTWRHPNAAIYYNDCWGYAANGREYAILGSSWGTHFFDVTNPTSVTEVASFIGNATNVVWRDFKTYGHYAYGVADGANNSLQIFDLSGLPDTVTKVYDSQVLSRSSHNVFIDNGKMYLCLNQRQGQPTRPVDIFSLADPENPVYLNTIMSPAFTGTHDVYVRNDTAYLSNEYSGLHIYNVANPMSPQLISSITTYPGQGYNHSNWTTANGKTIVFADEVPAGMPLKLYDLTNLQNPTIYSTFQSNPGATPHNPYIIGNHVVISYYKDGVQVFDISNPANPVRVGYYDTYPDNIDFVGYPYEGCWGVYPYLPSGNIIASDITYGLFMLTNPFHISSTPDQIAEQQVAVYPNPAVGEFSLRLPQATATFQATLYNTLGQPVQARVLSTSGDVVRYDAANMAAGLYTLHLQADGRTYTRKVVIR